MANVLQTAADYVNAAMINIGITNQIGSLYDGSKEANAALAIYGHTRDVLIRSKDWQFVSRTVALTMLKQAPTAFLAQWTDQYPPQGWLFEYAYPDDMVKLRNLKGTAVLIPEFDPQPRSWSIYNDTSYTPPRRTILCQVAEAIAVYAGQVTDPLTWPPDFGQALIDDLGLALSAALEKPQAATLEAAEGAKDTAQATMEQG
jgi:hypothetical protein